MDRSIRNVANNTTANCDHVGEFEHNIFTSKEWYHVIVSVLPYLVLSKMAVVHLVYYLCIFLNCEVIPLNISNTLSPREIVLRHRLDWTKHCCGTAGVPLEFGQYVEVNSDPDLTNSMVSRLLPLCTWDQQEISRARRKCLT